MLQLTGGTDATGECRGPWYCQKGYEWGDLGAQGCVELCLNQGYEYIGTGQADSGERLAESTFGIISEDIILQDISEIY
jgi:hypothetical protein